MLYYLLDSLYFVHLCLGIFLISCAVCLSFSIFAAMCCLFGVINEINKWNYQKQINLQNFAENTSHQCWQLRWRDIVKYSWKRWKQTLRGRFEAVNPSITALICACEWLAYIRANKIKKNWAIQKYCATNSHLQNVQSLYWLFTNMKTTTKQAVQPAVQPPQYAPAPLKWCLEQPPKATS